VKNIINKINIRLDNQDYISLDEAKKNIDSDASGFYWIFTSKTIQDFKKCSIPTDIKHVDLKKLSKIHENLTYIICQNDTDLWCIYNGKSKQLKKRIVQEFNQGKGTGTLALLRDFKSEDFKIKYIICKERNYTKYEKDFERLWRLNYKFPIFCRA